MSTKDYAKKARLMFSDSRARTRARARTPDVRAYPTERAIAPPILIVFAVPRQGPQAPTGGKGTFLRGAAHSSSTTLRRVLYGLLRQATPPLPFPPPSPLA